VWVLLIAGVLPASEVIELRLVDAAGLPWSGVEVAIVGRGGSVTADASGRVGLLGAPEPPFELAVFNPRGAFLGTVTIVDDAALAHGTVILTPDLMETLTVVPSIAPDTAAPPAAAATVWSAAERIETAPPRLIDIVEEIPGATRVGSGAAAVPAIRGLARGRTLLLIDGGRVVSERRAGPSATFLDPFSLERVEIVRGLGSVQYGSDALGGVIHARTVSPVPGESAGRYEASLGTGGIDERSLAVEWNQPLGKGALLLQAHARDASDYESPLGPVADSEAEDRGFLLRGIVPLGDRAMRIGVQRDVALDVGKPSTNSDEVSTVYPQETSTRASLSIDLPAGVGFSVWNTSAVFSRYRLITDKTDLEAMPQTKERADVDAKDLQLRLDGTRELPRGVLHAGVDLSMRFDLSAENFIDEILEAAVEDAQRSLAGIYTEAEADFRNRSYGWAAGLRFDRVRTRNRGGGAGDFETADHATTGYLALRRRWESRWEASLRYGQGFRDPGLSDRYFSGVTGRGLIVGEPTLEAERSRQWDAAVAGPLGGKSRLAIYAYRYRIEDLIERFRDPLQVDVFLFRNRGSATLRGLEMEWDATLPKSLSLRVAANAARGVLDDGTSADDIPGESLALTLRQHLKRGWWRIHVAGFARDEDPGAGELTTPGYVRLDAGIGRRIGGRGELRLLMRNLLDRNYPESADDRSPSAPGRRLLLAWSGSF
jgi:iron complex outermembrane receptor protein